MWWCYMPHHSKLVFCWECGGLSNEGFKDGGVLPHMQEKVWMVCPYRVFYFDSKLRLRLCLPSFAFRKEEGGKQTIRCPQVWFTVCINTFTAHKYIQMSA